MIVSDRVRAAQIRSIYRNTPPGMLGMAAALSCYIAALAYIDAVETSKAFVFVGLLGAASRRRACCSIAHTAAIRMPTCTGNDGDCGSPLARRSAAWS